MEIKILRYSKIEDQGILRGQVDMSINGWIVRGLRITQHDQRREPYLVMTKGKILDIDTGRVHFEQTVFMPIDLWKEVERIALTKFKEKETVKDDGTDSN
jgi:hypothetical protein